MAMGPTPSRGRCGGVTLRGLCPHSHAMPDLPYGTEPTYHLRATGATASIHPTAIGELLCQRHWSYRTHALCVHSLPGGPLRSWTQ
jgi:hypothetical protein